MKEIDHLIDIEDTQYEFKAEQFSLPPIVIKRITVDNSKRYYYSQEGGEEPFIYASGTTMIDDAYKESFDALTQWKIKMRMMGEDPNVFAQKRADYGTMMHTLIGNFLQGQRIPLGDENMIFKKYLESLIEMNPYYVYPEYILQEYRDLRKDILAFQQFAVDYNVQPLAIEMMLGSKKYAIATAVDLICYLDLPVLTDTGRIYKSGPKKGKPYLQKVPKKHLVILDFKSGRKGFFEKHKLQLLCNEIIVNENYPDMKVEKMFNWSPKAWRRVPSYNFTDQTDSRALRELLDPILKIGKFRHENKRKKMIFHTGSISFRGNSTYQTETKHITEIISQHE